MEKNSCFPITVELEWFSEQNFNAVAIWPVTGQGFQNTKSPAVLYSQ